MTISYETSFRQQDCLKEEEEQRLARPSSFKEIYTRPNCQEEQQESFSNCCCSSDKINRDQA